MLRWFFVEQIRQITLKLKQETIQVLLVSFVSSLTAFILLHAQGVFPCGCKIASQDQPLTHRGVAAASLKPAARIT